MKNPLVQMAVFVLTLLLVLVFGGMAVVGWLMEVSSPSESWEGIVRIAFWILFIKFGLVISAIVAAATTMLIALFATLVRK